MKTNYHDWRNGGMEDVIKALITIIIIIVGLFTGFFAISCEAPTSQQECKADSLTTVIDSLQIQVKAWENVVSLNHINLERNQQSVHDLAAEIEARDEQIAKFKNRLDSAAAIIKRQEKQLANSIYNKLK